MTSTVSTKLTTPLPVISGNKHPTKSLVYVPRSHQGPPFWRVHITVGRIERDSQNCSSTSSFTAPVSFSRCLPASSLVLVRLSIRLNAEHNMTSEEIDPSSR